MHAIPSTMPLSCTASLTSSVMSRTARPPAVRSSLWRWKTFTGPYSAHSSGLRNSEPRNVRFQQVCGPAGRIPPEFALTGPARGVNDVESCGLGRAWRHVEKIRMRAKDSSGRNELTCVKGEEERMTRWMKVLAVVAVLAAIVAVMSGGAGATSSPSSASHLAKRGAASNLAARRGTLLQHANLRTVAGVNAYLRAIGVDPRGVVIQRGLRNYAGPSCPGAGWACASTAHAVVQIGRAGGMNRFLCARTHCAVVQASFAASPNKGICIKTTGLTQSCTIVQTSA